MILATPSLRLFPIVVAPGGGYHSPWCVERFQVGAVGDDRKGELAIALLAADYLFPAVCM